VARGKAELAVRQVGDGDLEVASIDVSTPVAAQLWIASASSGWTCATVIDVAASVSWAGRAAACSGLPGTSM
jgi:hypothetical protein